MSRFKLTPLGLAIPEGTPYVPAEFYPPGFWDYSFHRPLDTDLSVPNGGTTFAGELRLFGVDIRPHGQLPATLKVVVSRRGSKKERRHLAPADVVDHATDRESSSLSAACGNELNKWEPAPDLGPNIYICTKAKRANGSDVWCESCINISDDSSVRLDTQSLGEEHIFTLCVFPALVVGRSLKI